MNIEGDDLEFIFYLIHERATHEVKGSSEFKAYAYVLKLLCSYFFPSKYEDWMG